MDFLKFVGGSVLAFMAMMGCFSAECLTARAGGVAGTLGVCGNGATLGAELPTAQVPVARAFDAQGREVCDVMAGDKLVLVKSIAEGQTPPPDARAWEDCAGAMYRAAVLFKGRIDKASAALNPPPAPAEKR